MKGFLAAPTDRSDIALEILREEVEKVTMVNEISIKPPIPTGPVWRGGIVGDATLPGYDPIVTPFSGVVCGPISATTSSGKDVGRSLTCGPL